jgi:hypothetical protein
LARLTPLGQTNALRDNWWGAENATAPQASATPSNSAAAPPPVLKYPVFLSAADRKSADREWITLSAINGPEFLCGEVLRHARAKPDDARVPEALYRCISAVHLGPGTDRCDALAESAFHQLHREYSSSVWAAKNRFWYHSVVWPRPTAAFGR